jgi:predicted short-subunit dehydrogenase-like oxidoreductase (DUF2520 family)
MSLSDNKRIVVLGAGNVATFFALALKGAGWHIDAVYSRGGENASELARKVNCTWVTDVRKIESDAGIWLFALSDQGTMETIEKIGFRESLLLHTAGSLPLKIFEGHSENYGVLYPLQTISARGPLVYTDFPVCIESNSAAGFEITGSLARSISSTVYSLDSEKRLLLHLGAVFACNFTNHMYAIAGEMAARAGLPFEMYHSLIRETTEKAVRIGPLAAQTGPAARNDRLIIKKQLDLLSSCPEFKDIYGKLSESIRQQCDKDKGEPGK